MAPPAMSEARDRTARREKWRSRKQQPTMFATTLVAPTTTLPHSGDRPTAPPDSTRFSVSISTICPVLSLSSTSISAASTGNRNLGCLSRKIEQPPASCPECLLPSSCMVRSSLSTLTVARRRAASTSRASFRRPL